MPRSKAPILSDESWDEGREGRRRVVKACQRCRLKKCRCDGVNPCTRCKLDDAICAYGKHRKSDKTVFRKGYVQMLERQHTQLISGLQELYRRIQSGEPFPSPPIEPVYDGQPLTHKILEALGVLQSDEEWEDGDKEVPFEGTTWQGFEQDGYTYDVSTATTSPVTQTAFSSPISIQTPFPQSAIMAKRARKLQGSGCMIINDSNNHQNILEEDTLAIPPMLNTSLPPSYQTGNMPSSFQMMQQQQQQPQPTLHYYDNGDGESGFGAIDWATFGCNEDLFNNNQVVTLQQVT